jgi:hypothetical protein
VFVAQPCPKSLRATGMPNTAPVFRRGQTDKYSRAA